jgi:hypothetical protein
MSRGVGRVPSSIRIVRYVGRKGPNYWAVWVVPDQPPPGQLSWVTDGSIAPSPKLRNAALGAPKREPLFFKIILVDSYRTGLQ